MDNKEIKRSLIRNARYTVRINTHDSDYFAQILTNILFREYGTANPETLHPRPDMKRAGFSYRYDGSYSILYGPLSKRERIDRVATKAVKSYTRRKKEKPRFVSREVKSSIMI